MKKSKAIVFAKDGELMAKHVNKHTHKHSHVLILKYAHAYS